jgi:hypothetical protein
MAIGCGSSTEPDASLRIGTTFVVHDTAGFMLPLFDGGGRWFASADTGVWYDMAFAYTFRNITSSTHSVTYKLEIGEYKNGKFQWGNGELFYDGDSVFLSNESVAIVSYDNIIISKTVGVGRKNNDWSYSYGYRITFYDEKNDSLVIDGSFDDTGDKSRQTQGSSPLNRFHGVIFTTEQSPDSLGILDGPDDGDWIPQNSAPFINNSFPNPFSNKTTLLWLLPQRGEVFVSVNKTYRETIYSTSFGLMEAGQWKYELSMDSVMPTGIKPGMYRVFLTMLVNDKKYGSKGDIIVTN